MNPVVSASEEFMRWASFPKGMQYTVICLTLFHFDAALSDLLHQNYDISKLLPKAVLQIHMNIQKRHSINLYW